LRLLSGGAAILGREHHMPRAADSELRTQLLRTKRLVPLLLSWYSHHARDLPWRRTRDPYAVWISEIMLQQTQVKTVLPYWRRWMRELPTLRALAQARPDRLHKLWEGLGYYRRVRNLRKAARISQDKHAGRFPERFDDVLALPGIGRYTAGAICSIAFNQPTPVLDGNVLRILTRLFGIEADPRASPANALLWQLAESLVRHAALLPQPSTPSCSHLNQSLMELGALICAPRDPRCDLCPVARHCAAFRTNRVRELPALARLARPTARRFAAFLLPNRGRYLVRRRPHGVVNARLWEFPNTELNGRRADLRTAARRVLGFAPRELTPLCTIKHSITRYRITLEACVVRFRSGEPPRARAPVSASTASGLGIARLRERGSAPENGRWLTLAELKRRALPSAHKKILETLAATG
jgi:A/G-specific adenine glycosylase